MNVRTLDMRALLREIGVGLISIFVVMYMITYVTGQHEQNAFAFDVVGTQEIPAGSAVVYGVVSDKASGKPIRGATLTLARTVGNGVYSQVGTATSAADGTFRIEVAGAQAGEYRLVAEALVDRRTSRTAFHLTITPGTAYGVQVELINKEYFVLLPLPGY